MNKQELQLVQCYYTVKLCKNSCKYYVISTSICLCNTFTIKFVKVALLTPFEELLTRNRAMSLMLVFGAQISDVFAKNGRYYSVVLSKRGAIYPLFCQKGAPLFRSFCQIATLLWTEKYRFQPI